MQLRPNQKEQPDINLTSLIDVVFLLLIFFMISTTFEESSSLQVSLPEASTDPTEQTQQSVILAIDADGVMALDDQVLPEGDENALRSALTEALPQIRRSALVVRADGEVAHRHVVTVMDMAGQLGITNLSIATIKKEGTQ